jgi:hypothetical protein
VCERDDSSGLKGPRDGKQPGGPSSEVASREGVCKVRMPAQPSREVPVRMAE